jgi:hypothetical protein
MTTAYTSLLGLALPVTGELSGTWGDTVNTAITSLLDTAIAGTTSITTDADITLSTTTGASNQARQAIILWNPASGTTTRNITAPAQSKMYVVINASGGTQSIVIRGAGPTTGVTIAKGESATVAWNGSDFVKVSSSGGAITFTDLTVTGNTILGDAAADTLTVNATSTFASPVSFQGLVRLPSTGRSAAAALTVTAPAFLYGVASTYTDTTSSGTIAAMAPFYALSAPTLSTSNVTTYSFASTMYIAGAPAAGGSATITNPYALYVNSGASYLAGVTTLGNNLLFGTDNTYDIGASGATRPRDMFLGRNLTVGGTLTLAGGVNLNGNVTIGDSSADTLTVNSTITSNLIFTDNTYDIGASGATRPRNLYLAGNEVVAGSVTWSGGTANGIVYLNGSKVATSGSALTYTTGVLTLSATNAYAQIKGATSILDLGDGPALCTTTGASDSAIRWDAGGLLFSYGSDLKTKVLSTGAWRYNTLGASTLQYYSEDPLIQGFSNSPTVGRGISFTQGGADTNGAILFLNKTRASTAGTYTLPANGDSLGGVVFSGGTGTGMGEGAKIYANTVGTPTSTSMASKFGIATTPSGSLLSVERITVLPSGYVGVNQTSPAYDLDLTGTMRISQAAGTTNIRLFDTTNSKTGYINWDNNYYNLYTNGPFKVAALSTNGIDITTDEAITGTGVALGGYSTGGYKWLQSFDSKPLHINKLGNSVYICADGSGSVGVGSTTTNGYAMRVYVATDTTMQLASGNGAALLSFTPGGTGGREYQVYSSSGPNLVGQGYFVITDASASANRFVINSSGQIALRGATSTAGSSLDVAGGVVVAPGYQTTGGSNTGYGSFAADRWLIQPESASTFRMYFMGTNGSTFGRWETYCSTSTGSPALQLTVTNGAFAVAGALSKGSGSFKIDHPLPQLEATHHLVHSFIEGPQADLIYRGVLTLVEGKASVNIDTAAGMTEGTFVALCRDVQCFTSNESDWVHVRGAVSGNILTIEAQDPTATSKISWMVVGERKDKHMMDTGWTDENGKVIVEPLKPADLPPPMVKTQE